MSAEPTHARALMDPQQVTLQVAMVDDEEPLCLGVRRILDKYQVHVADVVVDVNYEFPYFGSGEEFLDDLDEGGARRPAAARPQAARHQRPGHARRHRARRAATSSPS